MFSLIYSTISLQVWGLTGLFQYLCYGKVSDNVVEMCKNSIIGSGYVMTKLCQWMLPHLQVVYDVENENWYKILEDVYEDCYVHNVEFTKQKYYSSFEEELDEKYEIIDVVASGSIGQVYKIRDKETKEIYAMKCKHPYVNFQYYITTFFIKFMLIFLTFSKILQSTIFPIDMDVFYQSLKEQIYLSHEAKNLERMYNVYEDNEYILIPKIKQNSDDIIIMEYIEGKSFFELDVSEYQKNKIAVLFFITIRNMIIIENFIHGDLHRGNWKVVMEDNKYKIVLYDMGYCFNLPEGYNVKMFEAIEENNIDKMTQLIDIITTDIYKRGPEQSRKIAENELSINIKRPCTIKELISGVIDVCKKYKYILKGYFISILVIVDQTTFLKHKFKICTETELRKKNKILSNKEIYLEIVLKNEFPDLISFCESYKIYPKLVEYYKKKIEENSEKRKDIFESCDYSDIIDPSLAIMN